MEIPTESDECKLPQTYLMYSQRLLDCEENKEKRISST